LWFNPRCSKCKEALALLEADGVRPTLRRYLEEPPTATELRALHDALGFSMLRVKEGAAVGLSASTPRSELLSAIAKEPVLLERPILVAHGRAVVGRPPERVLELIRASG
jgi:arsenate reductase